MKKTALILTLFFIMNTAFASEFQIPLDFLNDIAKVAEFKTGGNFIQNLLIKQIVNNTTIKGVKLKDFSSENLAKYFNSDGIFSKKGTNVLVEPITGATLEFNSDGECKGENCTITVDMNGEKGPNEFWTQEDLPKDKMKFIIKRNDNDEITVITPEFIR